LALGNEAKNAQKKSPLGKTGFKEDQKEWVQTGPSDVKIV
jgi:hypothetical protein